MFETILRLNSVYTFCVFECGFGWLRLDLSFLLVYWSGLGETFRTGLSYLEIENIPIQNTNFVICHCKEYFPNEKGLLFRFAYSNTLASKNIYSLHTTLLTMPAASKGLR